ncbi:MAG TPA: glutaredoxin 3 [Rickettsiales bacterium]|nr:glutaredoxin 3 [Rickettsiales bacterium]
MKEIIIYSKIICPYCVKAKFLLKRKKVDFKEIIVDSDEIREEMIKKSGGRMTVPQIFIDGKHIGGCDDLYELEAKGELDGLLY